jgi:hypothetical protein
MAICTFIDCSSIAADITNAKKRPDSSQYVLKQCTTVVFRPLATIVTGELYFKAY